MKKLRQFCKDENGFSLTEVLVALAIMSTLTMMAAPKLLHLPNKAKVQKVNTDLSVILMGLQMYQLDNSEFPSTEQGLAALVEKPKIGRIPKNWQSTGYLQNVPIDPWGSAYHYEYARDVGEIRLSTLGRDGEPGGSGLDSDVTRIDR